MTWDDSVRFMPWVGESYEKGMQIPHREHGVKVLIIGESHYNDGTHDDNGKRTFTQDVVSNYLDRGGLGWRPSKFWTVLGRTIAGRANYDRHTFWNSVAYYVFVQDFAGDRPRQRPTDCMWRDSYKAFREVLEKLAPEKVIVLGNKVWSHVRQVEPTAENGVVMLNSVTCGVMNLIHPSSFGYRSDDHYPKVSTFLEVK